MRTRRSCTSIEGMRPTVAGMSNINITKGSNVDTEQQAQELRQDLDALEQTAEQAADRFGRRVAPFVVAVVVLAVVAWIAGRRARNRTG